MAATAPAPTFHRPDESPEIAAIRAELRPVLADLQAAEKRQAEIRRILDPTVDRVESIDMVARNRAWLDQVSVERRVLELQLQATALRQTIERLIEADIARLAIEFARLDRMLVEELGTVLTRAASIEGKRRALSAALENATGRPVDRGFSLGLDVTDPESRLTAWREWARRERGLSR